MDRSQSHLMLLSSYCLSHLRIQPFSRSCPIEDQRRREPQLSAMPRAVLVSGTPGVGKTTFAGELAALAGWKHLEVRRK